jgi:predicted HTH transcriptional regulator
MGTFFSAENADLTLLGWPESGQVEFKKDIPERNDKQDPWHDDKDFAPYGRDKLFKEIVAFANTMGGHLVLGIDEEQAANSKGHSSDPTMS